MKRSLVRSALPDRFPDGDFEASEGLEYLLLGLQLGNQLTAYAPKDVECQGLCSDVVCIKQRDFITWKDVSFFAKSELQLFFALGYFLATITFSSKASQAACASFLGIEKSRKDSNFDSVWVISYPSW
jgi:hypothetical protein